MKGRTKELLRSFIYFFGLALKMRAKHKDNQADNHEKIKIVTFGKQKKTVGQMTVPDMQPLGGNFINCDKMVIFRDGHFHGIRHNISQFSNSITA